MRRHGRFGWAFVVVCLVGVSAAVPARTARAATLPSGFTESFPATGLSQPTAMAMAPDGRIFICQQGGALRVVKNGALLPTPFVTVSVNSSGERGLLGVAFDPGFSSNNFVYVYYTTATAPIHNRISRFTANGDVAVLGSELVIVELENLSSATNHNGGAIHFGPDGKLYVGVGENANGSNAQTLSNRLGKLLRINANGSIPTDNPFYNVATGNNRSIWALGLRNPFTFAFQPGTGRLFINDVGAATWEEINNGIAGRNYGWPNAEGPSSNRNYTSPLFYYGHGSGATTGCAIAGGAFYNPQTVQFPASYVGDYFFADLCSGWIRGYDLGNNSAYGFATGIGGPVDLLVAPNGSLYYLARGSTSTSGVLGQIQYNASSGSPPVVSPPTHSLVAAQALGHPNANTYTVRVQIAWSASDPDGIASQQLQFQVNGGGFVDTNPQPQATTTTLNGDLNVGSSYQFRVRATDRGGATSAYMTGPVFSVDGFQENNKAIRYTGRGWVTEQLAAYYGGSARYASLSGFAATFTFTGGRVAWISAMSTKAGRTEIWLDGQRVATIDLYSATARNAYVVWTRNGLPNTTHTVMVRVLGTKSAPSTGTRVYVDGFVVLR